MSKHPIAYLGVDGEAIAYLRVSTHKQEIAETIETQRYVLAQYTKQHNIKLNHSYEDEAVSGSIAVYLRPSGSEVYKAISSGKVKLLILFHGDRIGRDTLDTLLFHRHAKDNNVRIIGIADNFDSFREGGELEAELRAVISAEFRRDIIRKTRAGLRRRAASGKVSNRPPYGFLVNAEGRLIIDKEKAEIIAKIFRWYARGIGISEIVRRLTEKGAPSPSGRGWRTDTILIFLKRRSYMGEYVHFHTPKKRPGGGKRIPRDPAEQLLTKCPAIVSPKLFDAVQKRIVENTTSGPESTKRTYLLRRLIRCATCKNVYVGHAVVGRKYKKKDGTIKKYEDFIYYECASLSSRDYKFCGSARVAAQELEEQVWSDIEGFLRRPSALIEMLRERYQQATESASLTLKIKKADASIKKSQDATNRIVKAIGCNTVTKDDASYELERLAAARNALIKERDELKAVVASNSASKDQISDAREMLEALSIRLDEGLSKHDKYELIRLLVSNIKITTVIDEVGHKRPHAKITYGFQPQAEFSFSNVVSGLRLSSRKKKNVLPRN